MSGFLRTSAVLLAAALIVSAAGCDEKGAFGDDDPSAATPGTQDVDASFQWALEQVQQATGRKLLVVPPVQVLEREAFIDAIEDDTWPLAAVAFVQRWQERERDSKKVAAEPALSREAQAFAEVLGTKLGARFVRARQKLLVCRQAVPSGEGATGARGRLARALLEVDLCRELVRALDYQDFRVQERLQRLSDQRELTTWLALTEGHAQWVTAGIFTRAGRKEELATWRERFWAAPPVLSPERAASVKKWHQRMVFGVHDGKLFFENMAAGAGADPSKAVFATPPTSPHQILDPAYYRAVRGH